MKFCIVLFLLFFLPACAQITDQERKEETVRINRFFDEVYEKEISFYPTYQTYMGRKTNYGFLDNETESFVEERFKDKKKTLSELNRFRYEALDQEAKLSYDLLKYELESEIEGHQWRYHYFPLNQMFGYQSEVPSFLINMHLVDNESDAMAYISRLKEISRVFSEKMDFLKKQEKLGVIPPKFVFSKVLEDSKNIITGKPFQGKGESPLYEDFRKKVQKLKLSDKKKTKLLKEAQVALKAQVLPAYENLISYWQNLERKAHDNHGAWALPDGREYYEFALKSITTTDLVAEEIHQKGLKEVARIQKEMLTIMEKVGFKGTLQEFFQHMRGKNYYYPNTAKGRKAYLEKTNKVIAEMKNNLPRLFKTFPKAKMEVRPVEAFREKSAGTAFYSGPPLEGERPGIYYVNLYKMEDVPKYRLEALAYHEGIPGHHMQIALAQELEHLPKFRRTGGFTSYVEGWGLYAELLPKEIGFYQDPYSDFGRLSMEIWRAVRLVVDTGIHAKKWSREKAISYMRENSPSAELETTKEIERYFVMPGQATAYKIGMMKFLSLREKAKDKLGKNFDIREYHDVVLRNGAIPLELLEKEVDQWVEGKLN